ncbi:pentapeptide repeat-containing protein [Streptomyces sp. NPDC021212]|uniref:pentapeptide repeat-containing protein n=1 Tax=Streptomyces sp. NPDC021212 TaxID=3365118 RepID=UPI0037B8D6DE
MTLASTTLPALAAVAALVFTWVSVDQNGEQLRISEQGQITDRFNAAVEHLASNVLDVRLGGIYALQRIMTDSPRDEFSVIQILAAFVRERQPAKSAPEGAAMEKKLPSSGPATGGHGVCDSSFLADAKPPATDIRAAVTALAQRERPRDGNVHVDLTSTSLRGMDFSNLDLRGFILSGADLGQADFTKANLNGVDLSGANLVGAGMDGSDLRRAVISAADFRYSSGEGINLAAISNDDPVPDFSCAYFERAKIAEADITGIWQQADLRGADLSGASLQGSSMENIDLTGSDLTHADLRYANLTGANLRSADLSGAQLQHAVLNHVHTGKGTKIKLS